MKEIIEIPSSEVNRKALINLSKHRAGQRSPAAPSMFRVPSLEMRIALGNIVYDSKDHFEITEKLVRLIDYLGKTPPSNVGLEGMMHSIKLDTPPRMA